MRISRQHYGSSRDFFSFFAAPLAGCALFCIALTQTLTAAPLAGQVVAWGGGSALTNLPPGLNHVVSISAGWGFSLALNSDGTVVGWGDNTYGQAALPAGVTNVTAIAAGLEYSVALKTDSTVVAWGNDSRDHRTDVPAGLSNVVAISTQGDSQGAHSMALKNDGTVVCWGENSYGESTTPDGVSNIVAVAAGTWHSVALKNDGTLLAWGDDTYSQTDVPDGSTNIIAISAGDFFSLALKSDSTVIAWGYDGEGETDVPAGLSNVVAIAAGAFHGLAVKDDGSVVSWGATYPPLDSGQTNVPAGLGNVIAAAGGENQSLAISIPLTISIMPSNQNAVLGFHTFSGRQYTVQYSGDLNSNRWTNLPAASILGNGFDFSVTDTNALINASQRFYRIEQN